MYTTLKIPVNGQELHIPVKIEVYTMWSLLYLIITRHRIRCILEITHIPSGWLVSCFWFNGPLRQYFSLYRAVSQRERERREK